MAPFLPAAIGFLATFALASAWRISLAASLVAAISAGAVVDAAVAFAIPDIGIYSDLPVSKPIRLESRKVH